jgi:hypothetical protein
MMPLRPGTVEVAPTAGERLVVESILHSVWRGWPGTRVGGGNVGVLQFGIELNDLALHSGVWN